MSGISFFFCVGKPVCKPKVEICSAFARATFGPCALWILFYDWEDALAKINLSKEGELLP